MNAMDQTRRAIKKRAVSMPEVLVVGSVIAFMLALLVPGLGRAREQMRRTQCMNNLRQWGIALQMYRDENTDFLPTEGTYLGTGLDKRHTWYNGLPPYLGLPAYKDFEGANVDIKSLPEIHVWICPAKNLTDAFKSGSGKNQFHYGMNQVLDGLGSLPSGSVDTPGFPDLPDEPMAGKQFLKYPNTVFLFDIAPNSPAGTPRDVAMEGYRDHENRRVAKFHGDFANFLTLAGGVVGGSAVDLTLSRDLRHGPIRWDNPRMHWGYSPRPNQ